MQNSSSFPFAASKGELNLHFSPVLGVPGSLQSLYFILVCVSATFRCRKWPKVVGCEELLHLSSFTLENDRLVCSKHFQPHEYYQMKARWRLKRSSIASCNFIAPPLTDNLVYIRPDSIENAQKVPCESEIVVVACPKQLAPSTAPSMPRAQHFTEFTENQFDFAGPSDSVEPPPAQPEVLLQSVGVRRSCQLE